MLEVGDLVAIKIQIVGCQIHKRLGYILNDIDLGEDMYNKLIEGV